MNYNLKELKAQVLYRLEDYSECVKIYRDIIKNTSDEYEDEHQTNMSAALVFLDKDETVSWSTTATMLLRINYFLVQRH